MDAHEGNCFWWNVWWVHCIRGAAVFAFRNLTRWLLTTVFRWLISTPSHISCGLWRAYKRGTWPILEQLCTGFLASWMYSVLHLTSIVTVQFNRTIRMPTDLIPFSASKAVQKSLACFEFINWDSKQCSSACRARSQSMCQRFDHHFVAYRWDGTHLCGMLLALHQVITSGWRFPCVLVTLLLALLIKF